jgi:hypothetical protein
MFGIAAIVAFLLAYLMHGFGAGNAWVGWVGLMLLGLACLAVHLVTGWWPTRRA